jgi:cytoskeletal protein RodZ
MVRYIFRGGVGIIVVVCALAILALAAWGTPSSAPSSTTTPSSAPSSTTTPSSAPSSTTTPSSAPSSTTTRPSSPPTTACVNVNGPIHLPAGSQCPPADVPITGSPTPATPDVPVCPPDASGPPVQGCPFGQSPGAPTTAATSTTVPAEVTPDRTPTPAPGPVGAPQLPATGKNTLGPVRAALIAILAGVGLIWITRRRAA